MLLKPSTPTSGIAHDHILFVFCLTQYRTSFCGLPGAINAVRGIITDIRKIKPIINTKYTNFYPSLSIFNYIT